MIRNLTGESFCTFGAIISKGETPVRANHHSISLSVGSTWTYHAGAQTWLGPESGLAILSVSRDGICYEDFFLDRQVLLNDGIWFCLTAFQEVSSVQMAAVLLPWLEKTGAAGSFAAHPALRVKCIYTLFYQEKEKDFLFPGETHSMAELVYVDEGSIHSVAQGQDILLHKGDMMLYAPNQWHMQYAGTGQAPRIVTVTFDAEGADWEALAGRCFASPQKAVLLLQQMLREQEQMQLHAQDMIFTLLTQLLLLLQREGVEKKLSIQLPNNFRNENEIIRRAQQYIGENVCCKLSVPVVAQAIGVSASYLTALFHKHLQIAPAEYIRRIKLQKSKQMIREGNLNFTEIAQNLQYSTIHHFSRQFKEKFGITPSEYAKTVRG